MERKLTSLPGGDRREKEPPPEFNPYRLNGGNLPPPPLGRSLSPIKAGERIEDCSCLRGSGWRPGARWAGPAKHELGRREEPAPVAFSKPMPVATDARRGRPGVADDLVVTTHKIGNQMLLAAASPAVRRLGVVPGMPLTQARILVPGLEVREAEPEKDRALLERLALFAARRWTPRAGISGADGLWLDLTGVEHLFGGEEQLCRLILNFCARVGLDARIAVAGTLGAAHALARFGGDRLAILPEGSEAQALSNYPIAALRLDQNVLRIARRLGIDRIGELVAMPRAPLQRRFGNTLLKRLDQALGRTGEAVDPIIPEEPVAVMLRFAEPIATAEAIAQAIGDAMEALVVMLGKAGLGLRLLRLVCTRVDHVEEEARIGTARASRDGAHLLRLLLPKIETIDPGFGIERLELVALRVEPLGAEPIVSELAGPKPVPDLAQLVDCLAGRLGARRVYRMSAIESDVAERSTFRAGALEQIRSWPSWPRPARLLARPEPLSGVMALLPDQPPRRFIWRGRPYRVVRGDGPERIHGEWWRRRAEAEAVRDYFQVEDDRGARFWLFRKGDGVDPRTGDLSWWLQGMMG